MTRLTRLRRLWHEDHGVTAAMMAIFITFMAGITATAVDLGVLFTAKSQLQNAADAAALAAANTMVSVGPNNEAIAQPATALTSATLYASSNQALGVNLNLKSPLGDDFIIGYWDENIGGFDMNRTGLGLSNSDDLNAVQVRVRRDDLANTPVSTYFARIFNIDQVPVRAVSIAFLGYPGKVDPGVVDLPIAVKADALTGGNGPECGKSLTFNSENTENSEWTTFFTAPSDNPSVDAYVTGDLPIPGISVGDDINVINGNLSNNTFDHLAERFNANQVNGEWSVTLPVIQDGGNSTYGTVVGFCTFVITEVRTAPFKDLTGHLACQMVVPSSPTGGGNFGTRASSAKMIR